MQNYKYMWGPYFWKLMHSITLLYPQHPSDMDRTMMRNLFYSYVYLLPCISCRNHYSENLDNFYLSEYLSGDQSSDKNIFRGSVLLHNIVNKTLKKKIMYDDNKHDDIKKSHGVSFET